MTKLFALGALGAGIYGAVRAAKQRKLAAAQQREIDSFDYADLDEPVVVTEEVIIVTEAEPFDTGEQSFENKEPQQQPFEMPGRGAGPR